jgi:hypothetical protein
LDYATYTASGQEDASAQLARLQQVVDGLLQALPTSSTTLAADLRLLGKNGASSLGATKLATMLVGLAASFKTADGFYATDLPITPIDSGGAPSYSVDNNPTTGVKALVSTRLAGSQPPGANLPRPRVELLNGVGSPGLVATACPKLAAHNFAYAGSGNSEPFSNANSQITVPGSKLALGYEIASALRLPRSDVLRTTQNQSVADAIVVLGGDYKP